MAKDGNPRAVGKIDKDLGQRIKLRRVQMKMAQRDLAQAIGVSFQQLQIARYFILAIASISTFVPPGSWLDGLAIASVCWRR
jgi:hypothetical protein